MWDNTCALSLKPASWIQTVANGDSPTTQTGRTLIMLSGPVDDSNLVLSNGVRVQGEKLSLSLYGAEEARRGDGTLLEHGIGFLVPYPKQHYTFGGWFCLKPPDFVEVWEQIRNGGYSDCEVTLWVGPVIHKKQDWLWQLSDNSARANALFIEAAEIHFTHTTVTATPKDPTTTRSGWFGSSLK